MRWLAVCACLLCLAPTLTHAAPTNPVRAHDSSAPPRDPDDLAGGVLICHAPTGLHYSADPPAAGWCAFGPIDSCGAQRNDEISETSNVWFVLAAWQEAKAWCGVQFGLDYASGAFTFLEWGICAPSEVLEIAMDAWPAPGTGTAVVTSDEPWNGNFIPVYWFGGYAYEGGTVALTTNPESGSATAFSSCSFQEYEAACYGAIGFGTGAAGSDCCPGDVIETWACCLYDGDCILTETEAACAAQGGIWHEGLSCEDVDCPAPAVCCVGDACMLVHAAECAAAGGNWYPQWETCSPNPCETIPHPDDLTGGVFICHAPAGLLYTEDPPPDGWCPAGDINACHEERNSGIDETSNIWFVLAAWEEAKQWCRVDFGLTYPEHTLDFVDWGMCVPSDGLAVPTAGWPAAGTGVSLATIDVSWQGNFTPVYWFGSYADAGGLLQVTPHPEHGDVAFANCSQEEFPAECYGGIGFGEDQEGIDCCPEGAPLAWACCLYSGECILTETEAACLDQAGAWHPGIVCEELGCPAPHACCVGDLCLLFHEDECTAAGGAWHPEWDSCEPNNCALPQPEDLEHGVLICHAPAGLHYTQDAPPAGWCPEGGIAGCEAQRNDALTDFSTVWFVLAAWEEAKEWCGVEFGLEYDPGAFDFVEWGTCVPNEGLEIASAGWPAPGTGVSVAVMDESWQGNFVPVYWFGGYAGEGGTILLIDHPGTAGTIAFSNCQSQEFAAGCFGGIGFGADQSGVDCCPDSVTADAWACCLLDGSCVLTETQHACWLQGGVWFEGETCETADCSQPDVCCLDDACVMVAQGQCDALGGEWHPEFEDCDPDPCNETTAIGQLISGARLEQQQLAAVLTWRPLEDARVERFDVVRRELGESPGTWSRIASVEPTEAAWCRFRDERVQPGRPYRYRIEAVLANGESRSYGPWTITIRGPARPQLLGTAPNPFRAQVDIRIYLPHAADVRLDVFAPSGRRIRTLHVAGLAAGAHALSWDRRDQSGRRVAPGTYFYAVHVGAMELTGRLIALR